MKSRQRRFGLASAAALALALPGAHAACWQGDASSGELGFTGQIEGENFFGTFSDFEVQVCRPDGAAWENSEWSVRVATASADTRNRDRDETLHGEEFFAVDQFPQARWESTQVRSAAGGLELRGELQLRGYTAAQTVQVSVEPDDGNRLSLTGSADISRLAFGVGQGEFEDTDFIRDRVDLEFELQLTRQ
jgi:polyisoprenoid-binding protein YceI